MTTIGVPAAARESAAAPAGRRPDLVYGLSLLLLAILTPARLDAWGNEGHQIVALVAESRLDPPVRALVEDLLRGQPMAEAAMWADAVRNERTRRWHFVDIEIADSSYDPVRDCDRDRCVIAQIERWRRILSDPGADLQERRNALKYVIHFVGDVHQPLHAADNRDRGGNGIKVEFFGQTTNPRTEKQWDLHAVWDMGLIDRTGVDVPHYAERLNAWLREQPVHAFQGKSVVDWAMEAHQVAKRFAYAIPPDLKLGEEYQRRNAAIVDEQLAKAGVRLAEVLNEALKGR